MQSASKEPLEGVEALSVLTGVTELYVAKGKKSLFIDFAEQRPSDDELLTLLLGRSGTLRAPSIRTGERLIVGYNAELLESALL